MTPAAGVVIAYAYMVEFQRRGLPHLHLLIVVRSGKNILAINLFAHNCAEDRPITPAIVDRHVSAQLPDPQSERSYFDHVVRHMVHGASVLSFSLLMFI